MYTLQINGNNIKFANWYKLSDYLFIQMDKADSEKRRLKFTVTACIKGDPHTITMDCKSYDTFTATLSHPISGNPGEDFKPLSAHQYIDRIIRQWW